MELVQTLVNVAVVTALGFVLGRMLQGQRQELKGEMADLRREMSEIRSDLTRVALAVGAEPRTTKR